MVYALPGRHVRADCPRGTPTAAAGCSTVGPRRLTAIRGFEWSEPLLGHVNVWFTEHYIDVVQAGLMQPLLDWLRREPAVEIRCRSSGMTSCSKAVDG